MANCNDLFIDFEDKINLSSSQKDTLRASRDAIKSVIKEYFKEINVLVPDFRQQGSFDMGTIINPASKDKRYDIDYGIYMQELPQTDTDKQQIEKIKRWIFKAVEGHTDSDPENKKNCVRVFYKQMYAIDLPVYKEESGISYIGTRDSGWQKSNPAEFTNWFFGELKRKGEQMRRVVKYLKAAVDYRGLNFKSIAITIAVAKNFVEISGRDDESFTKTLINLIQDLKTYRSISKPVFPYENVLSGMSTEGIDKLIKDLEQILSYAQDALAFDEESKTEASLKWQKIFGDRFKEYKKASFNNTVRVTTIDEDSPKPWGI